MKTILKYLSVFGIVLALVLTVGVTVSRSVHRRDLGTTPIGTANSMLELRDLNKQITSKQASNFSHQPDCENRVMPCDIVSCLENTTCSINTVKDERCIEEEDPIRK
jgi:hypothetical protein